MDVALAVEHHGEFALDFFKHVVETSFQNSNVLLSPISISTVMGMAGAGAKGETLNQITSTLKLPDGEALHEFTSQLKKVLFKDGTASGGPLVSFVNGLWAENTLSLKSSFKDQVKKNYGAEVQSADFVSKADEERVNVNLWVEKETHGKIKDLLPPNSVDEKTRLVLANALYFKGTWLKKFKEEESTSETFYLLNGQTVSVPMMHSDEKHYIRNAGSFKILRLPYTRGDDQRNFSMYILLPKETNGLAELEKSLDAKLFDKYLSRVTTQVKVGNFLLPRFKIGSQLEVPNALISLGLKLPFSVQADFSDMVEVVPDDPLYISKVFHQGFVEVNEEGSEAAAATAAVVTLRAMSMFQPPEDFVADHPFVFIIKEDITGLVLFIGHITDPSLPN